MDIHSSINTHPNKRVRNLFDKMISSNNLDKRMDLCDELINELEDTELPDGIDYDELVDELKDFAIG